MVGSSAGSIFVDVLLNDTKYQQGWGRARRTTRSSVGAMGQQIDVLGRRFDGLNGSLASVGRSAVALGASIAASFGVNEIIKYSDTMKQLEGRLRLVTDSSTELLVTQNKLFQIAQDTRTDYAATVTLYQRLAFATKNLGISQQEIAKFTEQFNKQLIVAGLTGNEVVAVIYQLTQAFNKGKLDGDEFRTVLESAPPILEALEKQTGRSRDEILKLSRDGKLAPRVLVDAVNNMADVTNKRFGDFALTVGQSFTILNNAIGNFVGNSRSINGVTDGLAEAIVFLSRNLDTMADVFTTVALIAGGKYVASIGAAVTAQAVFLAQTLRLQLALASLAGTSRITALALLSVGSLPIAAVGALAAGVFYLVNSTSELEKEQKKTNEALIKATEIKNDLNSKNKEAVETAKKLRDSQILEVKQTIEITKNKIQQTRAEAELNSELLKQLSINNALATSRVGPIALGINLDSGDSSDLDELLKEQKKRLKELQKIYDSVGSPTGSSGGTTGGGALGSKKDVDILKQINEELDERIILLETELDYKSGGLFEKLYKTEGERQAALESALELERIRIKLRKEGRVLDSEDKKGLEDKIELLGKYSQKSKEIDEIERKNAEAARDRARALEELAFTFGDAFEDAILSGKRLSEVLQNLANDIAKLYLRRKVTEPIISAVSGEGGILDSLGGLFGFSTGINYVPYDMTANIHRGEMIIPAVEAAQIRSDMGGGGGDVKVIINNNSNANVSARQQSNGNGMDIVVMVDDINAKLLTQPNSRTAQALNSRMQQQLVRR